MYFVLSPSAFSPVWQRIPSHAPIVDLAVEARRLLPREVLREVGDWEAAALAFAPTDGELRLFARARDRAEAVLDGAAATGIADAEAQRGARIIAALIERRGEEAVARTELLRGDFVRLCATVERRGIPIAERELRALLAAAPQILASAAQEECVVKLLSPSGRLDSNRVRDLLRTRPVPKSLTDRGELSVGRSALELAARADPSLSGVASFREIEGVFRNYKLEIRHGRNHAEARPFRATSGRSAPRGSILSMPTIFWKFIRPETGRALVYVDFSSQEIGIAAARSRDPALAEAYRSGDPYKAFATDVLRVGEFADARRVAKTCMLGLQYGMGATTLSGRIGCSVEQARSLVTAHRRRFAAYWRYVDSVVEAAERDHFIESRLGWRRSLVPWPGRPSVQNFPLQSTAVDMLVVAALLIDSYGIDIVALNHDAVLVEAEYADAVSVAQVVSSSMRDAACDILDGFELRTDTSIATSAEPFPRSRSRDERILRIQEQLARECGRRESSHAS